MSDDWLMLRWYQTAAILGPLMAAAAAAAERDRALVIAPLILGALGWIGWGVVYRFRWNP